MVELLVVMSVGRWVVSVTVVPVLMAVVEVGVVVEILVVMSVDTRAVPVMAVLMMMLVDGTVVLKPAGSVE